MLLVGVASFAGDVRVARLRGELVALAVCGSSKSEGWFRVATMLATSKLLLASMRGK